MTAFEPSLYFRSPSLNSAGRPHMGQRSRCRASKAGHMSAIDPLVRISLPLLNSRGRPHRTLAVAPRRPASLQCSAAYPSDTSPAEFVRLRGVPINRAHQVERACKSLPGGGLLRMGTAYSDNNPSRVGLILGRRRMLEAVPLPVRRLSARSTSPSGSAWDRLPEDDLENGKDPRIPGMTAGRGSG